VLVEPLLVRVEAVNAALDLGGGRPPLKLELAAVHHAAEGGERATANVLAAVVQARDEVRKEPEREKRGNDVVAT
jgi:hypothetical protein